MKWELKIYLDDNKQFEIFSECFDSIKEITDYLPIFKKDELYNIRHRNKNVWKKNVGKYSRVTLEKRCVKTQTAGT